MAARVRLSRVLGGAGVLLVIALGYPAGSAAQSIDIPSAAHLTIVGESDGAGRDVAGAGDVNGDGIPDVVVGDPSVGPFEAGGVSYVVFGRRTPGTVNLGSLGQGGFRITGAGRSVAGAGDVNDDGLADVIVTNPQTDFNGRTDSGSAYVVFGKRSSSAVELASLGSQGFRIDGPRPISGVASFVDPIVSVAGAGDVNGDGRSDVVVGFAQTLCFSMIRTCSDLSGSAYVVFGKATSGTVDTAASLGSAGYSIVGGDAGAEVAGPGDVNGDRIPDILVSRRYSNAGWLVFGRRPASDVDLTALGSNGVPITDSTPLVVPGGPVVRPSSVAWGLAGMGDVNVDGIRDYVVGVGVGILCCAFEQRAAVIFGGTSTAPIDIADLGSRGYKITGTGRSLLGLAGAAGDANKDGRGDAIVNADSRGLAVVFGKGSTAPVDVGALDGQGIFLTGAFENTFDSDRSFDSAGDMTGDGAADIVVGAPAFGPPQPGVGHVYVVSLFPSPLKRLDELAARIETFGLAPEPNRRLMTRVARVRRALTNGHSAAACRRLGRLERLAGRLKGRGLTPAQTFEIVVRSRQVGQAAGC